MGVVFFETSFSSWELDSYISMDWAPGGVSSLFPGSGWASFQGDTGATLPGVLTINSMFPWSKGDVLLNTITF